MTTNIELLEYGKILNIPNLKVVMKDELSKIPNSQIPKSSFPINIIMNLNDSDKNINGHWVILFVNDTNKIFYSSFGDMIPNEAKDFLWRIDDREILTSDIQIQEFNETICGELSIIILYLLNHSKLKFEDIILEFRPK